MDGFANLRENIRSEASSPSGTVGPQPEAGAGAVRGAAAAPAQRWELEVALLAVLPFL